MSLILRQTVHKDDGSSRINVLKFKVLEDGAINIWLTMGERWAKIKIDQGQQKELVEFVQRNIK